MSAVSDVMRVIKDVLRLTDDVERVGTTLSDLAKEVRGHDRRLIRLETQWETAMAISGRQRQLPPPTAD